MASEPATIDVKVKTLSSQTHDFNVKDDLTVRQFKEHISETVNVQADLQRIIYRGRILNDAIQLKEYDMHGKVVHLVERPPPVPGSDNTDTPQVTTTGPGPGMRPTAGSAFVYPGRRAANGQTGGVPGVAAGGNGPPSLNLSSTLCMNRITVARHMLTCAENIITHMDNPQVPLDNTPMDFLVQETLDTTVVEVGISAISDVDQDQVQNIMHAFRGAVNAALFPNNGGSENGGGEALVSDLNSSTSSTTSSSSSLSSSQGVAAESEQPLAQSTTTGQTATAVTTGGETTSAAAVPSTVNETAREDQRSTPTTTTTTNGGSDSNGRGQQQATTSPPVLGEVVEQMRNVQRRLEPHLQRYYDILINEPTYTAEETTRREDDQREFDRVSEALHYMSHAQHAISDLMLDLSTTTPRHLCCRPVLIEHSAFNTAVPPPGGDIFLAAMGGPTAGFQFTVPLNGGVEQPPTATAGNPPSNQANAGTAGRTPASAPEQPQPTRRVINATQQTAMFGPAPHHHHHHVATIPILVQHTTNDMPNMDQLHQRAAAAAAAALNSNGIQELIQSIVSAAPMATIELQRGNEPPIMINVPPAEQAQQSAPTSDANQTATSGSNGNNGNGRTTTATTMPTTSTQTRSTAQVHVTSIQQPTEMRGTRPFPTNVFNSFDRFLPCNSHHVRENQRAHGSQGGSGATTLNLGRENVMRVPQGGIHIPLGFPIQLRRRPASMAEANSRSASRDRQGEARGQRTGATGGGGENLAPSDELRRVYSSPDLDDASAATAREELRSFVVSQFFNNADITSENISGGVSEIVTACVEELLEPISRYEHPQICIRMSVRQLLRTHLQEIMNLLRRVDDMEDANAVAADARFGSNLIRSIRLLASRLTSILLQSDQRRQDIKQLFRAIFVKYLKDMPATLPWGRVLIFAMKVCLETLDTKFGTCDTTSLTPFLVYKSPAADETSPMEVEESTEVESRSMGGPSTISAEVRMESQPSTSGGAMAQPLSLRLRNESECEDYPEPTETEPWHSSVPNGWVTTLASDLEGQKQITDSRAQPLSDAYLDGMTKKRRKTITDARPTGSIPETISGSVRQVIQDSGFQTPTPVDQISTQISSDVGLQSSYRETVNGSMIRSRLRNDPNFDPKKYSNADKYFK